VSGCYIDNANGLIMMSQQQDNQQQTVETCVNACSSMGYVVAGMEYGVNVSATTSSEMELLLLHVTHSVACPV